MSENLKFFRGEPEEGTPTLGVVFHVVRAREIRELTGYEPIGYVIEERATEDDPLDL